MDATAYPMDPTLTVDIPEADDLRLVGESLVTSPPSMAGAQPSNILPTTGLGHAVDEVGADVGSALTKQIEIQTQLHEQLKKQRALQQAIEAHGNYLECILEQQRLRQGGGGDGQHSWRDNAGGRAN